MKSVITKNVPSVLQNAPVGSTLRFEGPTNEIFKKNKNGFWDNGMYMYTSDQMAQSMGFRIEAEQLKQPKRK